jgi:AP-4 complex subunit sigma-1
MYFCFQYDVSITVVVLSQIIRRCLSRTEFQCSFVEYRGYKIVYRRYASLFFVVAVDGDEEVRVFSCVNVAYP